MNERKAINEAPNLLLGMLMVVIAVFAKEQKDERICHKQVPFEDWMIAWPFQLGRDIEGFNEKDKQVARFE